MCIVSYAKLPNLHGFQLTWNRLEPEMSKSVVFVHSWLLSGWLQGSEKSELRNEHKAVM